MLTQREREREREEGDISSSDYFRVGTEDTLFQRWKPVLLDIDYQVRKHECLKGQCDKIVDPFFA